MVTLSYRKVTIKVATRLCDEVDARLESAHAKRDSFLNHLIICELPHLEAEMSGKSLSAPAHRYISRSLKRTGTVQLCVALRSDTADRLNQLVHKSNLVRDSLINRMLYFSLGSAALLNHLDVPVVHTAALAVPTPTSYFDALQAVQADPLGGLRREVALRHGVGLYLAELPDELAGLACFIREVPPKEKGILPRIL